ncbi:hypothetical protein [Parageobacillus toebii]|uniref:hypothetical protein n=1 Tax=Parageobacillus toebii TaxID=153151 RepID=UPI002E20FA25|nr:hypothetical protein [Parageobacillus toebii]
MKAMEQLMWCIALPGLGQLLNKKYFKGTLFILLEFLINVQSQFNEAIRLSFLGNNKEAIDVVDFQWLMFYPCLYFYAMWDAVKDAGGGQSHSHQVKNLIFFQRQKHGILSNENHRWKGLFFDGKKDEGMDKNDSSTLLL